MFRGFGFDRKKTQSKTCKTNKRSLKLEFFVIKKKRIKKTQRKKEVSM